jgi:hypothetical protein
MHNPPMTLNRRLHIVIRSILGVCLAVVLAGNPVRAVAAIHHRNKTSAHTVATHSRVAHSRVTHPHAAIAHRRTVSVHPHARTAHTRAVAAHPDTHKSLKRNRSKHPLVYHSSHHHGRVHRARVEARLDAISTHSSDISAPAASPEAVPVLQPDAAPAPLTLADASPAPGETPSPAVFDTAVPRLMPVALRGSHDVLVHQNIVADVEGLNRIQDDRELSAMVHSGELVALPASEGLAIDPRLPDNRRYCRPWTADFLADLARAHQDLFGHPLNLTSAVRTVAFQRRLTHYNANAAPAYGDTASPHLTGQAIDIGKKGMSLREIAWMRDVLGKLQAQGKLDVEEEFEQACFHISVYKTYAPGTATLPAQLIAATKPVVPPPDATAGQPMTRASLDQPVFRRASWRHYRSHHTVHHTVAHRRHRRHPSMALLAAGMR